MKNIITAKANSHKAIVLLLFILFLIPVFSFSQSGCPNADFSFQDFTNWQGFTGTYTSCCPTPGIVAGRHTIINAPGTDPNTGNALSILPPGLSVGARLGNQNVGYEAERLRYTLTVDASNSLFIYRYAVVLEDPSHDSYDQPKFDIKILNASGNIVDPLCGMYSVVSGGSIPGFQTYGGVKWKDWTVVGIDLSPYMGQSITIEYTTYDCNQGGHFGYAYLACDCMPMAIEVGFCAGSGQAVLSAPPGFTYLWNTGATTQTITVTNPTIGATYTCVLTAPNNCQITLNAVLALTVINSIFSYTPVQCSLDVDFLDNSTVNQGTVGTWSWNFGDGTTSTEQSPTHTFPSQGTYTVTLDVTSSAGGCLSSSTQQITIPPMPDADAGPDNSVCLLTYQLQAVPSIGTGTWTYTGPGTATFTDSHLATTSVTVSIGGVYTFTWSEDNGFGCTSTDDVVITFTQQPVANAGPDISVCQLNSTLTGIPSIGTGTWTQTSGSGTIVFTNASSATSNVSSTTQGAYSLTWTEDNGNGCVSSDIMVLTLTQMPVADAGAPDSICSLTYQLQAVPSVGTGTWTVAGPGTTTFDNANLPNATATVSLGGTYTFTWTENNGNGCTSNDNVVIKFAVQPVANAGTDNSVCLLSYQLQAIPSVGTGTWTYTGPGTATFGNIHLPSTLATITTGGAYTFTWTENNGLGCISSDNVVITFTQQPVANAGVGGQTCSHSFNLNGTASVGIGTWTANPSTGVVFASVNSAATNVTVTNDGTYIFTWSENNSGCTSSDNVNVTFNNQPISNAGPDAAVCLLSYTLQAVPSYGTGTWTTLSGPANVAFSSTNSPTATINVGISGIYTLIWAEDNGNGCTDEDTVVIQLTQIPTSTFVLSPIACSGEPTTVTYTGTGNSQCTYNWDFNNGIAIPGNGPGPHSVSWINSGLQTITLTVSLNNCNSPLTSVTVVDPAPLVSTISHTDIPCNGELNGTVDLTVSGGTSPYQFAWSNIYTTEDLSGIGAGIYSVVVTDANECSITNGTTVLEPPLFQISTNPSMSICFNQPAYLTVGATGGTPGYNYLWSNSANTSSIAVYPQPPDSTYSIVATDQHGCTATSSVTVYVSPPIIVTLIPNNDSICPGEPVMLTPIITGGIGPPYMMINQDGTVVTPPIFVYPEASGYYSIYVEDACGTHDTGAVYIHVFPLPPAAALADSLAGCQPFTVHFNEVNPVNGQSYLWNFGDNENLSLAHNPVHTFNQSGVFTVTLTVTSQWGCKTTVQYTDLITVFPKPNAQFTWTPEFASIIKPIVTFNNMTTDGNSYIWTFGDGDSSNIIHPTHRFPDAGSWPVQLIAISNMGCKDTIMYPIVIQEEYTFYAPTAFSPDFDQNNDFFFAFAHGIKETGFYLAVYDRWGEVIWETDKYSELTEKSDKWDGRAFNREIVPVGTYTWLAKFKDFKGNQHEKTGAITVIR